MSRFQRWLPTIFSSRPSRKQQTRTFKPSVDVLEDRQLLSTVMQLNGGNSVSSYAGVGFQENYVATLYASVNLDCPDHKVLVVN